MNVHAARLRLKTRLFTFLVILSSLCGNFSLSWGMRQVGRLETFAPLAYVRAVFNPWVALGISLLILWLFSQMALLSWADLSYVLPVTSIGYVLAALAGKLFLHEEITRWRWAGILLIVAGVALVARTAPHRSGAPS
jgi:drug/metabolite transporter (DMT)-like permease